MIRLLLALLVFPLASCNWVEPPLPAPNADRDPRLIGEWSRDGESKLTLRISPLETKSYRITLEGESSKMEFTGYHTDVEGIRIVSLELHSPILEEIKALKWLLLSYEFHADGSFSPLFLSREVLPRIERREDYLKCSGTQLFASVSGAAKSEYYRAHFFDTATEKITFKKKEPGKAPAPTR